MLMLKTRPAAKGRRNMKARLEPFSRSLQWHGSHGGEGSVCAHVCTVHVCAWDLCARVCMVYVYTVCVCMCARTSMPEPAVSSQTHSGQEPGRNDVGL